jgi:Na+-transporting NADH:ubiquinone oxidoreductase subunit C
LADLQSWWRAWRQQPPESPARIHAFSLLVAVVSALAVALAHFVLRPAQQANLEKEWRQEMERVLAGTPGLAAALEDADINRLEVRIVDLRLGDFARGLDARNFDAEAAAADPNLYTFIEEVDDFAGISRRPDLRPVYMGYKDYRLMVVAVPAYGVGFQSTIEAFVSLERDLNTIYRLSIHAQGEPGEPGTGITDPAWLAQWRGKKVRDGKGEVRIDVAPGSGTSIYEVPVANGAEASATGVANLVRFWLGDHGFGPFLSSIAREAGG